MSIPKTIGTAIKKAVALRDERLALQRKADSIKEIEQELHSHIIAMLRKQKSQSAKAGGHVATIVHKQIASIIDWPTFFKWMVDNDASDCVQKRIAISAVQDRIDNGMRPPHGVALEEKLDLSLTKGR